MLAEIITIGDELLIGQVVDTNSAWLGQQLSTLGIQVKQITSVSDEKNHILSVIGDAKNRAEIIIITGGLGPTKDDITKKTLCEYFGSNLVIHQPSLDRVKEIFLRRNLPLLDINLQQAEVPDNCTVLENTGGTAPGMLFEKNNCIYISLPGVPYEMKTIFSEIVIDEIKNRKKLPFIIHKTLSTAGIGESILAEKIKDIENALPEYIKLAYLPALSSVRLRLSGHGNDEKKLYNEIEKFADEIKKIISKYIFSEKDESLETVVGHMLHDNKKTLSMAESCTGGYISHMVTSVAGSSEYYMGSFVTYSYEAKENELGVRHKTLEEYGAVSQECVEEMAAGCRKKFNTNYAIAVSGIAGPGGGTLDKPVGTVWIAVATEDKTYSKKFIFEKDRLRNIQRTAVMALEMLRRIMLNIEI